MKRLALATYAGCPQLTDDDRLLVPALRRMGVEAVPVSWDAAVEWHCFDQVILRSCWDYHLRLTAFLEWIRKLDSLSVSLRNSANLVRWNADKRYLKQLQAAGARIPPTVWIDEEEDASVQGIIDSRGWTSAVVKPTVAASAHLLKRVFKDEPAVQITGPAMVQQFIPEIPAQGEWSLVFIAGKFSHAVVKRPTAGDFRVQWQFGGTAAIAHPKSEMLRVVTGIVESLPDTPLYARVDGVERDGGFVLMEVELIEPVLFLGLGGAIERLAAAITLGLECGNAGAGC